MTDSAAEVPEQPAPAARIKPTPWGTFHVTAEPESADPPTAILSAVLPETVHPETTDSSAAHNGTAAPETADTEPAQGETEHAETEDAEAAQAGTADPETEEAAAADAETEDLETEEAEAAQAETAELETEDAEAAHAETEDAVTVETETTDPEAADPVTADIQTTDPEVANTETALSSTALTDETSTPATGQPVTDGAAEEADAGMVTALSSNATPHASRGRTTVADEVVEKVAGIAAREVPGVFDLGGDVARVVTAVRERIHLGQESAARGVSVKLENKAAEVDVVIVIEFGFQVYAVADAVRDKVISSVEEMLGLSVTAVNVRVDDVHIPDHEPADDDSGSAKD